MNNFYIETPNLILRKFSPFDSKDVAYYSQQPNVAYWMCDMVLSDESKALSWINRVNENFDANKPFIILAVEHRIKGICIGFVGIHPKFEINNEFEILYGISDEYQHKGYATEACKALIQWVSHNTKLKFLTAIIKPENIASKALIEKLNFQYTDTKVIPYNGTTCNFNHYKINI